ncbi:MAG: hypothetical protein FD180_4259 [Planctomycetota bacterium]|nr:MAG: hypothetical protein FD180_4259 [Planctomycetota bacterium]
MLPPDQVVVEEVRIQMSWDGASQSVIRRVGSVVLASDADLVETVQSGLARHAANGQKEAPAIIDALPDVPWKDVIKVMDLFKSNGIAKVELTQPWPQK